jgi:hypothetical protein
MWEPRRLTTLWASMDCYRDSLPLLWILQIVGRSPWTGDEPVARPLPTQGSTNMEQTRTGRHVSSGIRTYDPNDVWPKIFHALDLTATVAGSINTV